MIRYLFYLFLVVLLVLMQTCILPYLPAIFRFYDFLVPFAVYLSLYHTLGEGLPVLLIAGLTMDMLSGAPIGIYLTTYLWVFVAFRPVPRWVKVKDHFLFSLLSVLGVLFENLIFVIAILLGPHRLFFTAQSLQTIVLQLFWAFVTAPFLWLGFQYLFDNSGRFFPKRTKNGS